MYHMQYLFVLTGANSPMHGLLNIPLECKHHEGRLVCVRFFPLNTCPAHEGRPMGVCGMNQQ